jgi:NtrC-family two-component system sensor histidine kinase KinB
VLWSLRSKILSGYGLILLLLTFILTLALISVQRLGKASSSILQENYRSIIAAEYMIDSIERQDSAALLLLLSHGTEGRQQYTDNIASFTQWLGRAKDNITIPGESDLVAAIEQGYLKYISAYEPLAAGAVGDPEQGEQYYHATLLPLFLQVRKDCQDLLELNQSTMYPTSEQPQTGARRATTSLLAGGGSVLLVGLLFSLLLSRIIVRPLTRVVEGIRTIEKGDYDVEISSTSKDELGQLSNSFNSMVKQLRRYRELNIGEIMAEKKKIETIMRNIDDGIVVVDTEAKITDINIKASEILGVKGADSTGVHFLELLGNEDIFQQMKKTLEEGARSPAPGEENTLTIEEGQMKRHYQFFLTPISQKPGRIQGAVLLLRDVTRLAELNQLKSEFIMKASHELKNPLTGLSMSISLLKEADLSSLAERDRQLIRNADEDLQRLKTMVDDLLDFSRIESGTLRMEIEETALAMVIDRAVEAMQGQAAAASVALSAEYPENIPAVLADANKILLVLTNLVTNALRYTAPGGFVKIMARSAGSYVEVRVQDNGAGIPYEEQARIFDKFFQVKGPPVRTGSLGLGLSICKEIVRAHGGTIWLDSTPGRGSTFSFTLPRSGSD